MPPGSPLEIRHACGRKLVGHQRIRPICVIGPEPLGIANGTEIDRSGPDDRQLGASPLLDDRQGHPLQVGSAALCAAGKKITTPRCTTTFALEVDVPLGTRPAQRFALTAGGTGDLPHNDRSKTGPVTVRPSVSPEIATMANSRSPPPARAALFMKLACSMVCISPSSVQKWWIANATASA